VAAEETEEGWRTVEEFADDDGRRWQVELSADGSACRVRALDPAGDGPSLRAVWARGRARGSGGRPAPSGCRGATPTHGDGHSR
jgi:hypothetical protein